MAHTRFLLKVTQLEDQSFRAEVPAFVGTTRGADTRERACALSKAAAYQKIGDDLLLETTPAGRYDQVSFEEVESSMGPDPWDLVEMKDPVMFLEMPVGKMPSPFESPVTPLQSSRREDPKSQGAGDE